jgi:hypothetical protein
MKKTKENVQDAETVTKEIVPQTTFNTMPVTVQECIKLSEMIAASDLAPKQFKDKPGNCYIAIQMGAEVGISPMQSIQNICVINGRPAIYGDMGKALLLSRGCRIMERDLKQVKELGEALCEITRPDGKTKIVRTFSMDDAEEAKLIGKEGPWSQYKWRMLAWRAFWFAARDGAADLLKGLAGVEEIRDYVETEVVPPIPEPTRASAIKAQDEAAEAPQEEPETAPADVEEPKQDEEGRLIPKAWFIPMKSKKEGRCDSCADEIMVADAIYWDPKRGKAHHQGHFKKS